METRLPGGMQVRQPGGMQAMLPGGMARFPGGMQARVSGGMQARLPGGTLGPPSIAQTTSIPSFLAKGANQPCPHSQANAGNFRCCPKNFTWKTGILSRSSMVRCHEKENSDSLLVAVEEATEGSELLENLVHKDGNGPARLAAVASAAVEVPADVAKEEQISQAMLIWRAVKLPLYTVALIPLSVGSAAAYFQTGTFHAGRYWSFLAFSVLVIAWLNLSNDAYDAETGVDKDKKESVVNMTGSRTRVLAIAIGCLALGVGGIWRGATAVGDLRVAALLAAAIACGYVYQCPPFRLSYKGLGEPLCFFAFGPLATTAFYLFQASSPGSLAGVSSTVVAASVLVGITTSLILLCSHFHQIEGDLAVGKMSPLVRLGTQRGARAVQVAVLGLYTLAGAFVALGMLPITCAAAALLTIPIGRLVVSFVAENHDNKSAIFMAKYFCVRLHTTFGLLLSLSLALGRMRPAF